MEKERSESSPDGKSIPISLVSPDGISYTPEFYQNHHLSISVKNATIVDCRDMESEDKILGKFLYHCLEFENKIKKADADLFFTLLHMIRISQGADNTQDRILMRPTFNAAIKLNKETEKYYCNFLTYLPNRPIGIYIHNFISNTDTAYINATNIAVS